MRPLDVFGRMLAEMYRSICFILLFQIIICVQSYKILVYSPRLGHSHVRFMGQIADILAKAGHDVVVYQPIYDLNINTTGTQFARVITRPRNFDGPGTVAALQSKIWTTENPKLDKFAELALTTSTCHQILCKNQLDDENLMLQLRKENFDVALGEAFDACYYGVLERIGLSNYITMSSGVMNDFHYGYFGIPPSPSYLPDNSGFVLKTPLSAYDRLKNLLLLFGTRFLYPKWPMIEAVTMNHFKDFKIKDKFSKSAFVFLNLDAYLEYPRPISDKIVYMGGMGQSKTIKLSAAFTKLLDSIEKGVILMSFGGVAKSSGMPLEMKEIFLKTFLSFPDIMFLWKYETPEDNITQGYKNVITAKWFEQKELLAHPKMLAFISHCGQNSVLEATFAGVPMICIPVFADQPRNAYLLESWGAGKVVTKSDVMKGKLESTIQEVISTQRYQTSAKRLLRILMIKPMNSEEIIAKYTEFVVKHGEHINKFLSTKMLSFFAFYNFDIVLFILIVIIFMK